jgi:hypothetical protein
MQRWEYMFVLAFQPADGVANQLGDQGWELVTAYPAPGPRGRAGVWLLFKRPKWPSIT